MTHLQFDASIPTENGTYYIRVLPTAYEVFALGADNNGSSIETAVVFSRGDRDYYKHRVVDEFGNATPDIAFVTVRISEADTRVKQFRIEFRTGMDDDAPTHSIEGYHDKRDTYFPYSPLNEDGNRVSLRDFIGPRYPSGLKAIFRAAQASLRQYLQENVVIDYQEDDKRLTALRRSDGGLVLTYSIGSEPKRFDAQPGDMTSIMVRYDADGLPVEVQKNIYQANKKHEGTHFTSRACVSQGAVTVLQECKQGDWVEYEDVEPPRQNHLTREEVTELLGTFRSLYEEFNSLGRHALRNHIDNGTFR